MVSLFSRGVALGFVDSCRDLGVVVDSKLKFHKHVDAVVGKAAGMMSNLLRSTVCRSAQFMMSVYVTHVRPIIEYCSCVWNVGYLGDVRRLESVQRRWTREVDGMALLEYKDRLRKLDLFSIYGRLRRIELVKIWKSFHCSIDVGVSEVFCLANQLGTRGHRLKLAMPVCRGETRRRSFAARLVMLWNSLPSQVIESPSVAVFKDRLDVFLGDRVFEVR